MGLPIAQTIKLQKTYTIYCLYPFEDFEAVVVLVWQVFGSSGFLSLVCEFDHLIDIATSVSGVSDKLVWDHLDPVGLFSGKT